MRASRFAAEERVPAGLECLAVRLEGATEATAVLLGRLAADSGVDLQASGLQAEGPPAGERAGVTLAGSRRRLALLAARLRGGPPEAVAAAGEIERCLAPGNRVVSWGSRTMDFRARTLVMGVLNCTPDSFYPGSRRPAADVALEAARRLVADGADIVDVGGESTRPGAAEVPAREEMERVVPVIRALRAESPVLISVDTRRHEVAEAALEAGADLVNDVSGLRFDPALAGVVVERQVPVVLMHMRGVPADMQQRAVYRDTVGEVLRELGAVAADALRAGVPADRIIVDPGIGFSKTAEGNLSLLRQLPAFRSLGFPLLVGLSRKSFVGHLTGRPVEDRLAGTVAANALAVCLGADIIRAHDVREAVDAVRIARAIG